METELSLDEVVKQIKKQQRELNTLPTLTGLGEWWNKEMHIPYSLDKIR